MIILVMMGIIIKILSLMNLKNQLIFLIVIPSAISLIFNLFNSDGLSLIATPIEKINSYTDLSNSSNASGIREIDISMAIKFHEENTLFVDARSEEYLYDGIIPGSIYSDDIDSLSTQIESRIGFDSPFIIYCSDDDCGSSEDLAYELQDFGFTNILVFSGGWKLWTESGRKIQTYE
jgi:hypothetical protein